MQFIINQTFFVQVRVSSCSETLTLVARYYKPKVFLKMPHFTQFPAKMVLVMRVQLRIHGRVLGESENHVGKTIGRNLGINLNQRTFEKKAISGS